jgi:RNA polymerase sigma-70 factor (ECF subfamily)
MYADNATYRQDLYQEIVLQAWKGYKGFRGDAKFSTWLYQVAINTAIAGLRKDKRSVLTYTPDDQLPDMPDNDADTAQLELLYSAIATLNEIEKAIVMLYLDDKSYDEMQEIMGIPNGALRVKMTRIKEKLRQITKNN